MKSTVAACLSIMELKFFISLIYNAPKAQPGGIFYLLCLCREKIKTKATNWNDLGIQEKELLELLRQAQARESKKQLETILAKNHHGLLTASDADWLTGIADELTYGKINEEELGFTAQSLAVIIDCIRQGDYARAVAS